MDWETLSGMIILPLLFFILFKYIMPLMMSATAKISGKTTQFRIGGQRITVHPDTFDQVTKSIKDDLNTIGSVTKKIKDKAGSINTSNIISKDDTRSKLEKLQILSSLKEKGNISESEFEEFKRKIMS